MFAGYKPAKAGRMPALPFFLAHGEAVLTSALDTSAATT
jgi:hypothetical protein